MDECVVPQPLYFILDLQFFSLEFRNMRFNRHVGCLLAYLSLFVSSYTLTTKSKNTPF